MEMSNFLRARHSGAWRKAIRFRSPSLSPAIVSVNASAATRISLSRFASEIATIDALSEAG